MLVNDQCENHQIRGKFNNPKTGVQLYINLVLDKIQNFIYLHKISIKSIMSKYKIVLVKIHQPPDELL